MARGARYIYDCFEDGLGSEAHKVKRTEKVKKCNTSMSYQEKLEFAGVSGLRSRESRAQREKILGIFQRAT